MTKMSLKTTLAVLALAGGLLTAAVALQPAVRAQPPAAAPAPEAPAVAPDSASTEAPAAAPAPEATGGPEAGAEADPGKDGAAGASAGPGAAEGPVTADPAPAAAAEALGTAGQLIDAVRTGQWRLAASLVLVIAMLLAGWLKVRDLAWFKGDRGGAILVGVLALGGALSTALASSAPLDLKLLLGTLGVMWTAVGGYTWVKRIIWPQDAKA